MIWHHCFGNKGRYVETQGLFPEMFLENVCGTDGGRGYTISFNLVGKNETILKCDLISVHTAPYKPLASHPGHTGEEKWTGIHVHEIPLVTCMHTAERSFW